MHHRKSRLGRLVAAASLVGAVVLVSLSFASLPAGAQTAPATTTTSSCPVLSVGNPNPGDTITPGGYVISGSAFDPTSTSGSGVARVDLFLGERDQGGMFLGSGVPGSSGTNPDAWTVTVTIPALSTGAVTLVVLRPPSWPCASAAPGAGEDVLTLTKKLLFSVGVLLVEPKVAES